MDTGSESPVYTEAYSGGKAFPYPPLAYETENSKSMTGIICYAIS
jgi:hypothetical protein